MPRPHGGRLVNRVLEGKEKERVLGEVEELKGIIEGEIPEGLYGAGIVEIWDKGNYEMEEKEKNKYVFNIYGKKLKGRYCLIRFKKDKWLFFRC